MIGGVSPVHDGGVPPVQTLALDAINLSDIGFWALPHDVRDGAFKTLREQRPIAFFEEPDLIVDWIPRGPGYHAVTRHADLVEISRRPDVFCSGQGAVSIPDMPPVFLEFFGSMINLDDPRHAHLRGVVSRGFTPKVLNKLEDDVRRAATEIIDGVQARGGCDFATDVAALFPLRIICDMMGISRADEQLVVTRSNIILSQGDPEYVPEDADPVEAILDAGQTLAELVQDLGRHRRTHPTDDLTSALVNANVDGDSLSDQELASFFILLVVAGNETTRNALSHGLDALSHHPDQRALWTADFDAGAAAAVEEIVRWASPVIWMRRTATQAAEVGGHRFEAGDKLLLFYNSANRDEAVFAEPFRFDIRRDPNPHVGFGGPGPHFCLGAHLARREITVMFRELFARLPDIHASGEAEMLRSSFINGVKHLPCAFTPVG